MNLFAGMGLINTNIKIKVELKTTLKNREKEYIMMSAEEVRKCQKEQQEKLSIDEIDLEKIQKEILEAIVEDSNVTSVCIFIGRLSIVAKLKSLGFGVDDKSGYGRGALYVVSWEGKN